MASPKPNRTISADFLFLAAKDTEILLTKQTWFELL